VRFEQSTWQERELYNRQTYVRVGTFISDCFQPTMYHVQCYQHLLLPMYRRAPPKPCRSSILSQLILCLSTLRLSILSQTASFFPSCRFENALAGAIGCKRGSAAAQCFMGMQHVLCFTTAHLARVFLKPKTSGRHVRNATYVLGFVGFHMVCMRFWEVLVLKSAQILFFRVPLAILRLLLFFGHTLQRHIASTP
jgi:hypothetical protein